VSEGSICACALMNITQLLPAGQLAAAEFSQRQTFILAIRLRSSSLNSELDIRLNDKVADKIVCESQSMVSNPQKESLAVTLRITNSGGGGGGGGGGCLAFQLEGIFKPCRQTRGLPQSVTK
jgi:hypothetical protein